MGVWRRRVIVATTAVTAMLVVQVTAGADPPVGGGLDDVRNVILFVGDGMGPEQLELGRAVAGGSLALDAVPWEEGTLDTTSLDGVTDSAAAATALATGVETNNRWVGSAPENETPQSVLERAEAYGKATGLVTDVDLPDATPAAFAAHVPDRGMDEEITEQIAAKDIEVLLSGGWSFSSLLENRSGVTYVGNLDELTPYLDCGGSCPTHLYGFFGKNELAFTLDREEEEVIGIEPTIPQLTDAAIEILSADEDGFFLMVEVAVLDWGGHARDAAWTAAEVLELDEAVAIATDFADGRSDTLVVVTGDHETGGLAFGPGADLDAIDAQVATTEWMWGLIKHGASITATMATYAGVTDLSKQEKRLIARNKEMGIADVLNDRQNVGWAWSGTDEGEHTDAYVPILAAGPGAASFAGHSENEEVGTNLLAAVDN